MSFLCGYAAMDEMAWQVKQQWKQEWSQASFSKRKQMARDYRDTISGLREFGLSHPTPPIVGEAVADA